MRYLAIILSLLVNLSVYSAEDCKKHPIYCQILDNRPNIDKEFARKLANVIFKYAKIYKLDAVIFTAMIAQESMYELTAKNCSYSMIEKTDEEKQTETQDCLFNKYDCTCEVKDLEEGNCSCDKATEREVQLCKDDITHYKKAKACFDFGLTQINIGTIEHYKFDFDKLTTDLDYSVKAGAIVLYNIAKQYQKKEPNNYWSRYNTSSILRIEYEKKVRKWLPNR